MKLRNLIFFSALALAAPVSPANKTAPKPAAKSLFLECGFETSKGQEYVRFGDYIFQVQAAKMKLIDVNTPYAPFEILRISPSKIEAVNRNKFYALSLSPNADTTYLTINRISGGAYFSFTKIPTAEEVRTCVAKFPPLPNGGKIYWCNDPTNVDSKGGACRPTKPKF